MKRYLRSNRTGACNAPYPDPLSPRKSKTGTLLPLLTALLAVPAFIGTAKADTAQPGPNYVVNSLGDTDDAMCGTTDCTLREAINAANSNTDNSIITFDTTVFAARESIVLNNAELPLITTNTTINGPTVGVIVDAGAVSRVMRIVSCNVGLNKIIIYQGSVTNDIGAGLRIDNANVTMDKCTVSSNASIAGEAGGIAFRATNGNGYSLTITNSTINNNSAGNDAGGLYIYASNASSTSVSLSNCTIFGNAGTLGGGLDNHNTSSGATSLSVTNCTFSNNSATAGDSIYNWRAGSGPATTSISNTILEAAVSNLDTAGGGTITSQGRNICTNDESAILNQASDQNNTDPLLDPNHLQDNGGITFTIALENGSPAINAGNTALVNDQRGAVRPQGSADDIGAFEVAAVSVTSPGVVEADNTTVAMPFTFTLSAPTSQTVTVDAVAVPGSSFPATGGSVDYDNYNTTITFDPGETSKTVNVFIDGDFLDENNERVALQLSNPVNTIIGSVQEGIITDNDPTPSISIADVTVTEGNGGSVQATFHALLSAPSGKTVSVVAQTSGGGGSPVATAGTDYVAVGATTLTFAPGVTTKPFTVTILGDLADEPDEKYAVNLSAPVNATIADATAIGTITDNDNAPTINSSAPNVTEGNAGTKTMTFTVSLSAASGKNITVQVKTANSATFPATAGTDYVAVPLTTLTFTPGQTSKTVNVTVNADVLDEQNERIKLDVANPVNATLGVITDGIIVDDDATPTLSINDVSITEGNAGSKQMVFTVTLSAASGQTVSVNAQTANGGSPVATAGTDYQAIAGVNLTFAPGQTSKTVSVTIYGDTTYEQNEKFAVNLYGVSNATLADGTGVGTITNDDPAPGEAPAESPSGDDDSK